MQHPYALAARAAHILRPALVGYVLTLMTLLLTWAAQAQVPTLTAVAPFIGVPGSVLTLTGTNLGGTTTVTFAGSAGTKTVTTGFTVNAAGTGLTGLLVPAGAQSGPVSVTTAAGTSAPAGTAVFSRAKTLAAGGGHTVAHLCLGRARGVGQQGGGGHHHARRAEPALQPVMILKRLLHHAQTAIGIGHAFEGLHRGSGQIHGEHGTGCDRPAAPFA